MVKVAYYLILPIVAWLACQCLGDPDVEYYC